MTLINTQRLRLRELGPEDGPFMLELLNDPDWLRFIGNRGVSRLDQARDYLLQGPIKMYAQHGFGLWLVETRADSLPMGICGLIRRDSLDDVDLGFAFLPAYRGQGYALEAARACLEFAAGLGLKRLVAITTPNNLASIKLLQKLGFAFERVLQKPDEPPLNLFGYEL